jgi:hypothetical protein
MKKLLQVLILIFCVLFLYGCEESNRVKEVHVLKAAGTDEVIIDANDSIAKPKMRFDIYNTEDKIPIARIIITQTTPTYSIGTIVYRMDGIRGKSDISDIYSGMICRETERKMLKAEKKVYKYQKKALKRQYKLAKTEGKSDTYKSLDKVVQDTNEISSIKVGLIKVEKIASPNTPKMFVPVQHEFVYDEKTQRGYISVKSKGLEARPWMIKQIEEVCSSKNIVIQGGTKPEPAYYRILDEKLQDGKFTIEFELVR